MRRVIAIAALAAAASVAAGLAPPPRNSAWSMSTTGRTISTRRCSKHFTKETGIKVRYDTFDANETLETKLLAGKSGYDVVVPTAYFLERQIKARRVPEARQEQAAQSHQCLAGDRQAACRLRSRQPIRRQLHVGHHRHRLQRQGHARAARRRTPRSTAGTWCSSRSCSPSSRTAACTCSIPPTISCRRRCIISGSIPIRPSRPTSSAPPSLLAKIRPNVRKFHSSEYLNALASGEICLVVGWSGDIKQAQKRAAEAKNGVEIGYAIPKEGAQMWFDNLAIPKDAPHPAEASPSSISCSAGGGGQEQQLRLLRQRQSGQPEIHRQGGARRQGVYPTPPPWPALYRRARATSRRSG